MKIKVLTYMAGDIKYFPYAEQIHRGYCKRHGYEYVIGHTLKTDRHIAWCKVLSAAEHLPSADYLLFLDADAYFYDWSKKIEDLISLFDQDYLMLFATNAIDREHRWDPHKDESLNPNSGVYLVKNHPISRQILNEWIQIPVEKPNYAYEWPVDQKGLEEIILPKYKSNIKILVKDYDKLNGRDGAFIRHLTGMKNDVRVKILKEECQRLTGIPANHGA